MDLSGNFQQALYTSRTSRQRKTKRTPRKTNCRKLNLSAIYSFRWSTRSDLHTRLFTNSRQIRDSWETAAFFTEPNHRKTIDVYLDEPTTAYYVVALLIHTTHSTSASLQRYCSKARKLRQETSDRQNFPTWKLALSYVRAPLSRIERGTRSCFLDEPSKTCPRERPRNASTENRAALAAFAIRTTGCARA